MDFVFFKFSIDTRKGESKNLLIRKKDISYNYIQLQIGQLFHLDEEDNYGFCVKREGDKSKKPVLVTCDKGLEKIKKSKRGKGKEQKKVVVSVITNEQKLKRYKSPRKKSKDKGSKMPNGKQRLDRMRKVYLNPIRFVKLKVDNTHDYSLPPELLEQFCEQMLATEEGQK